jgi:hypothetical protein
MLKKNPSEYTVEKMELNLHRSTEATRLPPYNDVNFKLKCKFLVEMGIPSWSVNFNRKCKF